MSEPEKTDREIIEEGLAYAEAKKPGFNRHTWIREMLMLGDGDSTATDTLEDWQVRRLARYVEEAVARHKAEVQARNAKPVGKDAMNQ
jgi:hypothetical protein